MVNKHVDVIFERIEKLTHGGHSEFGSVLITKLNNNTGKDADQVSGFDLLKTFLRKIFHEVDQLAKDIINDDTILISVKNQKLLRTCFQLITSLGISTSLIPGLGICLSKRCLSSTILPCFILSDEEKYEMLVDCTNFFTRSYEVPVLKNIIITLHLSDYLAALIQLSFATLKKPGTYGNFVMTQEMYNSFNIDRKKYIKIYEHLAANCFQPILMKELLVLQSMTDPPPPAFVKRVITKEMSQRLLVSGGLLSLIRCFLESYEIDTGFDWKKIDMICRLVSVKHGNVSENDYLENICLQLKQILLSLNNTHYLTTAVACILTLYQKYTESVPVNALVRDIFYSFDYNKLLSKSNLPGTIILSPQEVECKVNILHACVCTKLHCPTKLLAPNLYVLFLIGIKCTKNEDMKAKLIDITLKCLEELDEDRVSTTISNILFGKDDLNESSVLIEEYEAGIALKSVACHNDESKYQKLLHFINLFKASTNIMFVQSVFEVSLEILVELSVKRQRKDNKEMILSFEEDPVLLDDIDEKYVIILQLLSEISTSPKVVNSLKTNPSIVFNFIEHFILKDYSDSDEECTSIALVLLNTILTNSTKINYLDIRFSNLKPMLEKISADESNFNHILCKEALSLMSLGIPHKNDTQCGKAISNVFDNLLPVRAHGIMELTKLINAGDTETICRKHYIFCIFQEQLKDPDTYIYLSAINGLASLCTHCTEDVLHILCKEFLAQSINVDIETKDSQNKNAELRMKIADIIVKVTKRLGEMVVIYKTVLLNTMLCACRDEDPLIRTSALSNLAEIALVLHYRIGSIIYEVLLCIWSIIETDKAIECRRAGVMVISNLIKGLGKDTLVQLKENILPVYRTLKKLYRDPNEDSVVRLHAQIALEELNDVVNQSLFPELRMDNKILVMDKTEDA